MLAAADELEAATREAKWWLAGNACPDLELGRRVVLLLNICTEVALDGAADDHRSDRRPPGGHRSPGRPAHHHRLPFGDAERLVGVASEDPPGTVAGGPVNEGACTRRADGGGDRRRPASTTSATTPSSKASRCSSVARPRSPAERGGRGVHLPADRRALVAAPAGGGLVPAASGDRRGRHHPPLIGLGLPRPVRPPYRSCWPRTPTSATCAGGNRRTLPPASTVQGPTPAIRQTTARGGPQVARAHRHPWADGVPGADGAGFQDRHIFQAFAQIPSYSAWLVDADLTSTYAYSAG